MRKNYAVLIFFLFLGSHSFSQTTEQKTAETNPETNPVAPTTATTVSNTEAPQVFEKNPLPINQKGAPAIFYVENDKPTDRRTYQQHLQPALSKN
jgi:hypothetical protein